MKKASEAVIVPKAACPVRSRSARKEAARSSIAQGRVLVMDDEDLVRDVAGAMLRYLGYEAECVEDGAQAIETFKKARGSGCPYTIAVLDLTIPCGMGGRETLAHLIELEPSIKAFASSGNANDPVMEECSRYGFSGVLIKPYRMEDLSKVLGGVCQKNEL